MIEKKKKELKGKQVIRKNEKGILGITNKIFIFFVIKN